jgi:hypothetical protein
MDDDTVAFIMAERLSHENLKKNPHAVYLFMEDGEHWFHTPGQLQVLAAWERENV